MATTSFTLRKTTVGNGSFLQNDGLDSALRSDGFIDTTALDAGTFETNYFSANIITLNEIKLSWELTFSLSASATGAAPTALAIVASPTGEPITVKDGDLVGYITSNSVNSIEDIVRVPEGRWVYYSLFIKYSDFALSPTVWYERVASVYIQVPKQYKSVDNLWARIPEHYRSLDAQLPTNPLYNFIELFGWELDRTRTLIDTIALANDPELAVTPALVELAYETGVEFYNDVLGTTKTRALLQNIGYLRRRKGTIESISGYLSAMSGCQISYESLSSGASHNFKVHTQRVNFIPDSKFYAGHSGTTPTTGTYKTSKTEATTWGVYTYAPTTASGPSVSNNGTSLTVSCTGGTGNTTVVVYSKQTFPYYEPAYFYTGFEVSYGGSGSGASFQNFHIAQAVGGNNPWGQQTAGAAPSVILYDTWNTSVSLLTTDPQIPSRVRAQLVPNVTTDTTQAVYPALYFVLPPDTSVTIKNWMVEPYSIGDFFDGDSREGGITLSAITTGSGISDYRWASTPRASFSYYTLDYKRVYDVSQDVIRNYIAPVTIKDNVFVTFDYYPGK